MSTPRTGILYAAGAYLAWGLFPVYWRQLDHFPAWVILGHRILWSWVFLAILLGISRRWSEVFQVFRRPKVLLTLFATTSLVSVNWFLFIWAVNEGHVTQASLGYYINPLINVLLARFFLGETLRRPQLLAVLLAGAGVLYFTVSLGVFPWISVALASTFGVYGLVRKQADVAPLPGLTIETGLATPFAIALLFYASEQGGGPLFGTGWRDAIFLLGSGTATALPLLWFAAGAKRLRYTTMGILQYIAPTGQLALAVALYGESFTPSHAITFALIWAAIVLYAWDAFRTGAARAALASKQPTL